MSLADQSRAQQHAAIAGPVASADLVALLNLEQVGENVFSGYGTRQPARASRVFGGALIAQSLLAAAQTAPADRAVHSLHAYFLRPADSATVIHYRVETLRDGARFATRRVTAEQYGEDIVTMTVSFHTPEAGFTHQLPQLGAPPPASLPAGCPASDEATRTWFDRLSRVHPFELRVNGELARMATARGEPVPPRQGFWFRAKGPLSDDPESHTSAIAYASDILLLSTSLGPHGTALNGLTVRFASLDHAMWFHAPARADDWLYYEQESTWAGGARALCNGRIFDRDGTLVASIAQEGLIRYRPSQPAR